MANGTTILADQEIASDRTGPERHVVLSSAELPEFVSGRRAWVKYRELGVTEASLGGMRAQVIHAGVSNENTGWHLHRCDMQFLYVISGAITIAFNPERIVRLEAGDAVMIPGGTPHMEMGGPEGVEVLEVSIPADMPTENVPCPFGEVDIDLSKARRPSGHYTEKAPATAAAM